MAHLEKAATARAFVSTKFGYDIDDTSLILQAIGTWSTTSEHNKRLALIGDAAMGIAVKLAGFRAGYRLAEIDNLTQSMVNNTKLAEVARSVDLGSILILSPGYQGPAQPRTLATSLETILGAIFLDSNEDIGAVQHAMAAIGLRLPAAAEQEGRVLDPVASRDACRRHCATI